MLPRPITKFVCRVIANVCGTPAQRQAAQQEIEVVIAPNEFGGWSIYPLNEAAVTLFGGRLPAGNFSTSQAAVERAARHNCWTVAGVAECRTDTSLNPQTATHIHHA